MNLKQLFGSLPSFLPHDQYARGVVVCCEGEVSYLACCMIACMLGYLLGCLIATLLAWLLGWLLGWLVSRLVGCLLGGLLDQLGLRDLFGLLNFLGLLTLLGACLACLLCLACYVFAWLDLARKARSLECSRFLAILSKYYRKTAITFPKTEVEHDFSKRLLVILKFVCQLSNFTRF